MRRISILAWLCPVLTFTLARAEIPQHPEATTRHDYNQAYLAGASRIMIEAYRKHGPTNEAWDEAVESVLTGVAHRWAGVDPRPTKEALVAQCEALREAGCMDPMIAGILVNQSPGSTTREQLPMLESALTYMIEHQYSPYFTHWCAYHLWQAYRGFRMQADAERCLDLTIEYLGRTIELKEFGPRGLNACYRNVCDRIEAIVESGDASAAQKLGDRLRQTLDRNGEAWLAHTLLGKFHVKSAWVARGGDWASQVEEQGWRGFEEHLREARRHLTAAWQLRPDLPEPSALMITVCLGASPRPPVEARQWFERSVKAQFDYEPAYDGLLWLLRPRWHGSHELMYQLGVECAATKRFDTAVPWKLIKALQDIRNDLHNDGGYGSVAFWRRPGVYEQAKAVIEGYRGVPGANLAWRDSQLAAVAYRCERYGEAHALLEQLNDQANPAAFTGFGVNLDRVRGELAAMAGPFTEQIAAAQALAMQRDFAGALEVYEALQPRIDDPPLRRFLETRRIALGQMEAYQAGDVVDLFAPDDLAGWTSVLGEWSAKDGDAVVGKSTAEGLLIVTGAKFSPPWQLSGRVTFEKSRYTARNAMIVLACSDDNLVLPVVVIDPYRDRVALATIDSSLRVQTSTEVELTGEPVEFRIHHLGDRVSVWIDGQPVIDREPFGALDGSDARIGFGGRYTWANQNVRFDLLRIHRLDPPAVAEPIVPTPRQRRPGPLPAPL